MKVSRMIVSTIFAMATLISMSGIFTSNYPKSELTEQKPAVVFDLGGVLFKTNKPIVLKEQVGPGVAMRYAVRHACFSSKAITKKWFEFLDEVYALHGRTLSYANQRIIIKNEFGIKIPAYLIEWLCNSMTGTQIYKEIEAAVEILGLPDTKRLFMLNMSKNFLAHDFIKSRLFIEQTFRFIEDLKKEGYPLYVLSNWDSESFCELKKNYPDLFALFDGIMISADVKRAKPDPDIYQAFEKRFPHHHYLLIDDQEDNIAAALNQGWTGVHVKSGKPNLKKAYLHIAQATLAMNQAKKEITPDYHIPTEQTFLKPQV